VDELMAIEDYLEPEIAVTAVVTAAVFSPKARRWIRKGFVYGTAGILMAGDALTSAARNVGQGVQHVGASAVNATQNAADQTKATATPAVEKTTGNTATKKSTQKTLPEHSPSPTEGPGGTVA
jgi:hypothetical protein